jgi:hypothetical protein
VNAGNRYGWNVDIDRRLRLLVTQFQFQHRNCYHGNTHNPNTILSALLFSHFVYNYKVKYIVFLNYNLGIEIISYNK